MIREWIAQYNPVNQEELEKALREIMQEITLAGLYRTNFSLLTTDPDFSLQRYLSGVIKEFAALGVEVEIQEKVKNRQSNIESAFLKPGTAWQELTLKNMIPQVKPEGILASLKIKIEVDKKPPAGFETDEKLLLKPFSFYTKCYVLPDLFAGKMHALLFRKWGNRVKGRDWYDFEWYVKKGVPLHLHHLALRANDSGDWPDKEMSKDQFITLLNSRIQGVDMNRVKEDILPFIKGDTGLELWSVNYFKDIVELIRYK